MLTYKAKGSSSSSAESAAVKRRRLQNSCDGCRRRKIRCDSAEMPDNVCSRCILSKIECSHKSETKKRGPPKGRIHRVHRQTIQSLVSDILSPLSPFSIPSDTEQVRKLLEDLARHIRNLENKINMLAKGATSKSTESPQPSTNTAQEDNQREESSLEPHTPDSSPTADDSLVLHDPPKLRLQSPPQHSSTTSTLADSPAHTHTHTNTDVLSKRMKHLSLSHAKGRHFGRSNPLMLVQAAMDIKKEEGEDRVGPGGQDRVNLGRKDDDDESDSDMDMEEDTRMGNEGWKRSRFWGVHPWQIFPESPLPPLQFPPPDLLLSLIEIFITHTNTFIPLLHVPSFTSDVASNRHLHDRQFGEVVLAVCAVASKRSMDKRNLWDEDVEAARQSAGWKWYRQLTVFPRDTLFLEPPSLLLIQKYILCIAFLSATSTPDAGWVLTAVAIRLAQDVGVHRKQKGPLTIERELWKRAFWILVGMDTFNSTSLGRPSNTRSEDFDLDLPIECDDEYWAHPDPELAWKQPAGKPATCSYWIHMIKLLEVLAFAQRTVYSIRNNLHISWAERNQRALVEIDSALNRWSDSVPDHLKWNPNEPNVLFFNQSVAIHCTYYWLQIHVHRLFIPQPSPPGAPSDRGEAPIGISNVPSLAICANAARACSRVVDATRRRGPAMLPNSINASFTSAIVLLVYIARAKRTKANVDLKKEMRNVEVFLESLHCFEPISQAAGRYCDILNRIIDLNDLSDLAPNRFLYRIPSSEQIVPVMPIVPQDSLQDSIAFISLQSSTSDSTQNGPSLEKPSPTTTTPMYTSYTNHYFTPDYLPFPNEAPPPPPLMQFTNTSGWDTSSYPTVPYPSPNVGSSGVTFGSGSESATHTSESSPSQINFDSGAPVPLSHQLTPFDLSLSNGMSMSMVFGAEGMRSAMGGVGLNPGSGDWDQYMMTVDELLRFNGFPSQG